MPRSDQLELQRGPLATAPTNKFLHRITKELAKGKARRAVPPWSIPREICRVNKLRKGKDTARRQTLTRDIFM